MVLSISLLTRQRILIGILSLMISGNAHAQIVDWIIDQAAQSIVNEAEKQLGEIGNSLWNSIIESEAKASITKKANKLKDIEIDRTKELKLLEKYKDIPIYRYSEMYPLMFSKTESYLNPLNNIEISKLGNGVVMNTLQAMQDSIRNAITTTQLSELLTKQALDSLCIMENSEYLNKLLLDDINHSRAIAILLNNHPEAVRVYANLSKTEFRRKILHLYYWAVAADAHRRCLSKKRKLINPRNVKIVQSDSMFLIIYKGEEYGAILGNKIVCKNINLLNLCNVPNTQYHYNNMMYETDALGRVVRAEQQVNRDYKGKCKDKGAVKPKDCTKFRCSKLYNKFYSLGFPKYQSPDCNINTVYLKDDIFKQNKKQVKLLMKEINKGASNSYRIVTKLTYDDDTFYCKGINIELHSAHCKQSVNPVLREF
ncbi:hypothetical protein [Bacteroides acidifaciens]|uniref:hypothetical protein n=1 Tax=Bacteroides acidifaciens TaxID=85831 RepID=UPI002557DCC8|nr:hypothetical protein [Bacteroides acidifaciens]